MTGGEDQKRLELMDVDELLQELSKINKLSGFSPRKLETREDGALLLDPSNPYHREWYENDEDYE